MGVVTARPTAPPTKKQKTRRIMHVGQRLFCSVDLHRVREGREEYLVPIQSDDREQDENEYGQADAGVI